MDPKKKSSADEKIKKKTQAIAKRIKKNKSKAIESTRPKRVHVATKSKGFRLPVWLIAALKREAKVKMNGKVNQLAVFKLSAGLEPPTRIKAKNMSVSAATDAGNWTGPRPTIERDGY